ncbi:hypothetical protein M3Y97_00203000 [Aphelenchoides bicaudatus]|nr:hypothetical protein M3Y97_00203000 [Aphelenchoides bicaudatus]
MLRRLLGYGDFHLTRFSHWLEEKLERHRLLDVPRGIYWRIYYFSSYGHIGCSCILIVLSISCFCTGIQNSFMYDEINCADGTSLAAPMVNTFIIYYALMSLKQQGNYYAAFEHAVMSFVAFIFNGIFAIDQLLMGLRWVKKPARTDQNWPFHFAVMDFLMFALLSIMEIASFGVLLVYVLLLTDWAGWQRRAQRNIQRARVRPNQNQ